MAVNPDPRTLLLPDEKAIPSFLSDKYVPLMGLALGFGSVVGARVIAKRPVLSGIQTHLMVSAAVALISKYAKDRFDEFNIERDAILRHYIALHPEDFPAPDRVKIGDVFKPWHPVR